MWKQDVYVAEKLRELEATRPRQPLPPAEPRHPRRRLLAPIAKRAGHRIRHIGEAMEAWAAPMAGKARG
jgi:hypothetical protein